MPCSVGRSSGWAANKVEQEKSSGTAPMDIWEVDDTPRLAWAVAGGRVGHQRYRELWLHLWSSEPHREGLPKGRCKGKNGKGLEKGNDKGSRRHQGCGYRGACHFCGKVEHKRAECWKYRKDVRTRFAPWTSRRRRLSSRWGARRAGWWARWTRLYLLQRLLGPNLARWTKSGPQGLRFRAAHGHGSTDVCCNPFKVWDEEEDCDINEVAEESVNEVVDVTIDSGAGRNVWPKGKKVPGKLMPVNK